MNAYLITHPKVLLTILWVSLALALGIGVGITVIDPSMPYFRFLGWIIVPAVIALYMRILYSKVQDIKRKEREQQRAESNQTRYKHKKKK